MEMKVSSCTRCSKPFTDMKVGISLKTSVERRKANFEWEEIANLNLESYEVVCLDCFQLFAEKLKGLNNKKPEIVKPATDIIEFQENEVLFKDKIRKDFSKEKDEIPLSDPIITYAETLDSK